MLQHKVRIHDLGTRAAHSALQRHYAEADSDTQKLPATQKGCPKLEKRLYTICIGTNFDASIGIGIDMHTCIMMYRLRA